MIKPKSSVLRSGVWHSIFHP